MLPRCQSSILCNSSSSTVILILCQEEIMDIGKSFSFVFKDKKWIEKILIGGILMLIPILGPILMMGYGIQLVRNVRKHEPEPLPEWDEWGTKIAEGFKLIIIELVWALPLLILGLLMIFPMAFAGDSDAATGFASFLMLCFGCLTIIYAVIVWMATPGITIEFAKSGNFSDGFKVSEILDFTKHHLGQIVVVAIVSWLVYLLAGLIGALLCGVGTLFTMFWASLVYYHMVGQIGLEEEASAAPQQEAISTDEATGELPAQGSEGTTDESNA